MSLHNVMQRLGETVANALLHVVFILVGFFLLFIFPIGGIVFAIYLTFMIPNWTGLSMLFSVPIVFLLAIFFFFYVWVPHVSPSFVKMSDILLDQLTDISTDFWFRRMLRGRLIRRMSPDAPSSQSKNGNAM